MNHESQEEISARHDNERWERKQNMTTEPKRIRIPKNLEDLPPVFWVRNTATPTVHHLVTDIIGTGFMMNGAEWALEVCQTSTYREYSTDRKVWHRFYTEKEVAQCRLDENGRLD